MEISEDVLYNTLSQIFNKNKKEENKKNKTSESAEPFSVVSDKASSPIEKVDVLYELERKLIEALLLYGTIEEEFEDLVIKETEEGKYELEPAVQKIKVFEKIYLDLQDDEVAFTNDMFRSLYSKIIERLHRNSELKIESLINELNPEESAEISSIILNDEKYLLHRWDTKEVYVKLKNKSVTQLVSETILSLRKYLISQKIEELSKQTKGSTSNRDILLDIRDYQSLNTLLGSKLGRVLSV